MHFWIVRTVEEPPAEAPPDLSLAIHVKQSTMLWLWEHIYRIWKNRDIRDAVLDWRGIMYCVSSNTLLHYSQELCSFDWEPDALPQASGNTTDYAIIINKSPRDGTVAVKFSVVYIDSGESYVLTTKPINLDAILRSASGDKDIRISRTGVLQCPT